MSQITLSGQVQLTPRNRALPNVRVELWDEIGDYGWLASVETDKNGAFAATLGEPYASAVSELKLSVGYRFYQNNLPLTIDSTVAAGESTIFYIEEKAYDILLPDSDASQLIYTLIQGRVTTSKGITANNVTVNIYEGGFRDKTLLTSTKVDTNGFYKAKVALKNLSNYAVVSNSCIHVEVVDESDNLLVRSADLFNVQEKHEINLSITNEEYVGTSEYETLVNSVTAFIGSAPIISISRDTESKLDEFSLIANAIGREVHDIENLVRAYNFSNEIDPSPAGTYDYADFFYALGKLSYNDTNPASLFNNEKIELVINSAIVDLIIPEHSETEIEDFIALAKDWHVSWMMSQIVNDESFTIGDVFESIYGNATDGKNLLKLYHSREYLETSDFWDIYNTTYGRTLFDKVQKGLKLIPLTGTQPEMIAALMSETSGLVNVSTLAIWDYDAWKEFVDDLCDTQDKLCVPHFIPVDPKDPSNEDAKTAYAEFLKLHFQDYYPLTNIMAKLDGVDGEDLIYDAVIRAKVIRFIALNPEFDLRFSAIHDITKETHDIDEDDIQIVKDQLEPYQRLLRVTKGKPEAVIAMKLNGLDSATSIVDENEEDFVAAYAAKFGSASNAQMAYASANTQFAAAQSFATLLQTNLTLPSQQQGGPIVGIPGGGNWGTGTFPVFAPAVDPSEDPTWAKMFGNLDYCCCDHCMSLYSPAAYFTDILKFLKTNCSPAYNELIRRREDLTYIDLTCKNTNTPLPYIDLVNELLEIIMVSDPNKRPKSWQTNGTAKELAAHPEHYYKNGSGDYKDIITNIPYKEANEHIYDLDLANAVYPNFNFNYALEETRTYLKHLGTSRYEAMNLFRFYNQTAIPNQSTVGTPPSATEISDYSIDMEYLGLSKQDGRIICGSHSNTNSTWLFYGIPNYNNTNSSTPVINPTTPTLLVTGYWYEILYRRIDHLLHFAQITYSELLQFLSTDFLNPIGGMGQRAISIKAWDGYSPDTCDLSKLKLVFPFAIGSTVNYDTAAVATFFTRLHRFIRLSKKRNLTIYEWDILFRQIKVNNGTTDVTITNYGFNNKTVMQLSKVLRISDTLRINPLELVGWTGYIDTTIYSDHDCSGLKEKSSVYDRLFRDKAVFNPPLEVFGAGGALPTNESYIDNAPAIASVCNISEEDLILLLDFIKVQDPSNGNAVVNAYVAGEMTLTGLSRIYILSQLQKALNLTIKELLTVFEFILPQGSVYIQNPTWTDLDNLLDTIELINKSPFSISEISYLILNVDQMNVIAPDNATIQVFYESLRGELKKFTRYSGSSSALSGLELNNVQALINTVYQSFSKEFNVTSTWVQTIFHDNIDLPNPPGGFVESLINENFVSLDMDITAAYTNLYDKYRMFHKISTLTNNLKLRVADFNYLYAYPTHIGFSFAALPINPVNTSMTTYNQFDGLLRLMKWIEVRDKLSMTESTFRGQIFATSQNANLQDWFNSWRVILDIGSGWGEEIDELVGTVYNIPGGLLKTTFPANFYAYDIKGPSLILKMYDLLSLCKRIGLNPSTLQQVLFDDLVLEESNKVLQAAKSKHSEEAWLKIAKPLHDPLRENKRKALVGHILAHKQDATNNRIWRNENDLYAFLLIDVEMTSCMLTSRLKQGISSVQLFVDRVMMSLEYTTSSATISMQPQYLKQWKEWRKWYRVWEANRKVFLYPENWIEPDLRDDKTIFFRELETKLAQDEITDRQVEDALREYLGKLDDVARLEPIGFYNGWDPVLQKQIVHVFAKNGDDPQFIYYRRLFDNEWTGWEKVTIDINSDHIVPVVKNNRLFLFWLTFREKQGAIPANFNPVNKWLFNNPSGYETTGAQNASYQNQLEITINWAEYKDGNWLKQKMGKEKVVLKFNPNAENWLKNELASNVVIGSSNTNGVNPVVRQYYYFLTEGKKLSFMDFVKSRIMLYPYTYEGLRMMVMFPVSEALSSNFDRLNYVQSFNFKDMYSQPQVMGDWETWNISTPQNTVYKNQRFYENTNTYEGTSALQPAKQALKNDSVPLANGTHYWYHWESNIPNPHVWQPQNPVTVLGNQNDYGLFKIIKRADFGGTLEDNLFFYDDKHTFYARKVTPGTHFSPSVTDTNQHDLNLNPNTSLPPIIILPNFPINGPSKFFFQTFYHPHVTDFVAALNTKGIDGLLNIDMQTQNDTMDFVGKYQPTALVHPYYYPTDKVELDFWGSYSIYNWELFFHTPMLLAQRLMDNQKFEEAQKWFHYVFNPTSNTGLNGANDLSVKRFWKYRIFYDQAAMPVQTLNDLLILINWNNANAVAQVQKWEANPFKPHVIARMRILAYMKNVVMKYLDNLIAWADQLFARDTIESINEATNLYILADNILGQRPREVPKRAYTSPKSFSQLVAPGVGLDAFSNAAVTIESYISPNTGPMPLPTNNRPQKMFYFCLSPNDKLLQYWDTIADRLYKIRNCRNLTGQVRNLPLFEPPIDPAMLVRAAAAGLDINSVLNDVSNSNLPNYRFSYMLQKANEICGDVRGLGGSLLAALEKKDAEELALLRSTQEMNVLESVKMMKQSMINEAKANLDALKKTKEVTEVRYSYYSTRQKISSPENEYFNSLKKTLNIQRAQANLQAAASAVSLIPQFHLQATFAIGASFGGQQIATMLTAISQKMGVKAAESSYEGTVANTKASYERRWDDWVFQAQSAKKELEQIDKQIVAAEIRIAVAENDLESHEVQIENNKATDDYMRSKYTNVELYNWMITQISTTYFQAYRLAYEVAKKAAKCYNFELPLAKTNADEIIQFGYWDSLKKGLLCGERLQNDLRKLEQSYMEDNKRTLELTKHVSLATLCPSLLQEIKQNGSGTISIPESFYDLDYPGHFNRRIKSVSLTIPCVAGPYTTIPCTLSLGQNMIRTAPINSSALVPGGNVNTSFVATSSAQNDSGMFEFNYRDERYLPFEGGGAISEWTITLGGLDDGTVRLRPFDFDTISDIILHIKYTAHDGTSTVDSGSTFGEKRTAAVISLLHGGEIGTDVPLPLLFSMKHDFSTEWYAGFNQLVNTYDREFVLPINIDMFPHAFKANGVKLTGMHVYAVPSDPANTDTYALTVTDAISMSMSLTSSSHYHDYNTDGGASEITQESGDNINIVLSKSSDTAEETEFDNFYVVLEYKAL